MQGVSAGREFFYQLQMKSSSLKACVEMQAATATQRAIYFFSKSTSKPFYKQFILICDAVIPIEQSVSIFFTFLAYIQSVLP